MSYFLKICEKTVALLKMKRKQTNYILKIDILDKIVIFEY